MNDNLPAHVLHLQKRDQSIEAWLEQLEQLREVGVRAVSKPESLTMGEIMEMAWAFLMASGTLTEIAANPKHEA